MLLKSNNINYLYISIKHAPQVLPAEIIENIHEAKAAPPVATVTAQQTVTIMPYNKSHPIATKKLQPLTFKSLFVKDSFAFCKLLINISSY